MSAETLTALEVELQLRRARLLERFADALGAPDPLLDLIRGLDQDDAAVLPQSVAAVAIGYAQSVSAFCMIVQRELGGPAAPAETEA